MDMDAACSSLAHALLQMPQAHSFSHEDVHGFSWLYGSFCRGDEAEV